VSIHWHGTIIKRTRGLPQLEVEKSSAEKMIQSIEIRHADVTSAISREFNEVERNMKAKLSEVTRYSLHSPRLPALTFCLQAETQLCVADREARVLNEALHDARLAMVSCQRTSAAAQQTLQEEIAALKQEL
jgi:hypothetical protein